VPLPTVAERVAAGAAWLDEHKPGWWQRTDLDRLDVASERHCPLAQEYGTYYRAPVMTHDQARTLGFDCSLAAAELGAMAEDFEFAELTETWRALIEDRRGAAAVADLLAQACGYHTGDDCQHCADTLAHHRRRGTPYAWLADDIRLYLADRPAWYERAQQRARQRAEAKRG
jgi:hypothetical protein